MNTNDVVIANFHAHSRVWKGWTNGKGSAADIWRRYDSMGYRFHAVSQYHLIDTFSHQASNYVPGYEHGLNLKKTHQLVLGASSVLWKDYFFPQTIDNKQHIINQLAADPNAMVVLNHPGMRNGYTPSDFKKLYNYDFVEILNPQATSVAQWDTALSSGHPVFGIANDDVHDIFNNDIIGRHYTIIYGTHGTSTGMYASLKSGASIAVWLPEIKNESLAEKKKRNIENMHLIRSVALHQDTIRVDFSKNVEMIRLIGQNGKLLKQISNANAIEYPILFNDTYVRVELKLTDGTRFYMNPFFRY